MAFLPLIDRDSVGRQEMGEESRGMTCSKGTARRESNTGPLLRALGPCGMCPNHSAVGLPKHISVKVFQQIEVNFRFDFRDLS